MAFIQAWSAAGSADAATSETRTGDATTEGNTLLLDIFLRTNVTHPVVSVTDDADNTWEQVESVSAGSTNLYLWACPSADPVTSVTVTWVDDLEQSMSIQHVVLLSEFSDVGPLITTETLSITDGGLPTPIALEPGQLLHSTGGTASTDRTWSMIQDGLTATERSGHVGQQITHTRADGYPGTADDCSLGWERVSGSATTFVTISAAFDAPPPPPEPLAWQSATGLTVVGPGTLADALTDEDPDTYGETGPDLAGAFTGLLPAIVAPEGDFELSVQVSVNTGSCVATAAISPDGEAWTAAEASVPVTTTPAAQVFTWPSASLTGFDGTDWEAMQVRVSLEAQ